MNSVPDEYAHLLDDTGQLWPEHVEDLMVEVVSGKHIFEVPGRDDLYASRNPTLSEQDRGRIVYARRQREARKRGLLSKEEMVERGVIDAQERREKQTLLKMLERNAKARDQTTDESHKLTLTSEIEKLRKRILAIEVREHEVFTHSADAKASEARSLYFTSCCTLTGELLDEPVWPTFEAFQQCRDAELLAKSREAFTRVSAGLPISILRALARTEEWRVTWKAAKESGTQPFEGIATGWTANQRHLVYWSDFYDAVYQHPDAPPPETIQDDESLQQWMSQQAEKARKAKEQRKQMSPGGKGPVTYLDGKGQRKAMAKVGGKTVHVGQPFKVRGAS